MTKEHLEKELKQCSQQLIRLQKHSYMMEGAIQMLEKLIAKAQEEENARTE